MKIGGEKERHNDVKQPEVEERRLEVCHRGLKRMGDYEGEMEGGAGGRGRLGGLTYLHWAWKYLIRVCRKSAPFFTLISFTLSRYCRGESRKLGLLQNRLRFNNLIFFSFYEIENTDDFLMIMIYNSR